MLNNRKRTFAVSGTCGDALPQGVPGIGTYRDLEKLAVCHYEEAKSR
jgi:hypothetical protein